MAETKNTRFRLNIRNKLLLGFSFLFIILLFAVVITMVETKKTQSFAFHLKNQSIPTFNGFQDLMTRLYDTEASLSIGLITGNTKFNEDRVKQWEFLEKDITLINQNINSFDAAYSTKWQEIQKMLTQLHSSQDNIESTYRKSKQSGTSNVINDDVNKLINDMDILLEKIQIQVGEVTDPNSNALLPLLQKELTKNMAEVDLNLNLISLTQQLLLAFGIVLSFLIIWLTSRSIVNPIQAAIRVAKQIAEGKRDIDIQIIGNDESADLLVVLKDMHDSISETEKKLKYSETKIQNILDNLQTRIKKYRTYIAAVSNGDLTKILEISGDDDLARLGEHLNEMTQSLSKITLQILGATNEISTGLNQLESATTSQAASASQQATSVAEVSSVVEEIKATSQQTLHKASALGESAEKTHQEGEKWQLSVTEMTNFMQSLQEKIRQIADTILGLSDKTQQIGEITEVVSDIAKQSKMLALNASIEAAKAGEVGRGFAVVAGEVRELAEKSQGSTERVQKILQDIRQTAERAVIVTEEGTKSVDLSLERANQMGKMMSALGSVIEQSSMASQQIVAAVRQESAGIDQVVTSISEIDKVTNQFSSATEQTKGASVNLARVAQNLKKTVSVYKLTNGSGAGTQHAD